MKTGAGWKNETFAVLCKTCDKDGTFTTPGYRLCGVGDIQWCLFLIYFFPLWLSSFCLWHVTWAFYSPAHAQMMIGWAAVKKRMYGGRGGMHLLTQTLTALNAISVTLQRGTYGKAARHCITETWPLTLPNTSVQHLRWMHFGEEKMYMSKMGSGQSNSADIWKMMFQWDIPAAPKKMKLNPWHRHSTSLNQTLIRSTFSYVHVIGWLVIQSVMPWMACTHPIGPGLQHTPTVSQ